ncbi:hypothetical protein JKP88DRAFT_156687 [Tribonema minus]|uniref:Uncharacterized protein n=1 Tax=Tribonema minus TaxID=303371 RepID=A0A835ZL09_9STRA|nr:hypothetical protein JKP88DRAFT_156687 [Tribonema minus]
MRYAQAAYRCDLFPSHSLRADAAVCYCRVANPYLELWLKYKRNPAAFSSGVNGEYTLSRDGKHWCSVRDRAVSDYAWAIPSHAALELIVKWASVVSGDATRPRIAEIGSGTGYWASLLQKYGADVVAVEEYYKTMGRHFPDTVARNGVEYLRAHGGCEDRALFLCWQFGDDGHSYLREYRGPIVIFIGGPDIYGDRGGGCTMFFDEWEQVDRLHIPQWQGLHDELIVYRRRGWESGAMGSQLQLQQ